MHGCKSEIGERMSGKVIDLVGRTFGLLKVEYLIGKDSGGNYCWFTRCVCNNTREVQGSQLRLGYIDRCHVCRRKAVREKKEAEREAKKEAESVINHNEPSRDELISHLEKIEKDIQDFGSKFRQATSKRIGSEKEGFVQLRVNLDK